MQPNLHLHMPALLLACLLVLAVPDHSPAENGGGSNHGAPGDLYAMTIGKKYCWTSNFFANESECIKECGLFAELHFVPGTLEVSYVPLFCIYREPASAAGLQRTPWVLDEPRHRA